MQATARNSKDAWEMTLQTYTFYDVDGDGEEGTAYRIGQQQNKRKEPQDLLLQKRQGQNDAR